MTKLMRRLVNARIEPRFEVFFHPITNKYTARVVDDGKHRAWGFGDTPEAAVTRAVEDAIWPGGGKR